MQTTENVFIELFLTYYATNNPTRMVEKLYLFDPQGIANILSS